ncbi:hypothetical protein SAMN02745248_02259 [Hathewaya proteolytica DSM 3090]|uniref:Uncharacterized protein n=1 Tax=Hathewaya proteolytica DSM 3090 TaxID=1121331 RepID=A0A1M6RCR8_9CLOT|nr:hypothetical protein [Hathewaya proteolytica]SHK30251.1 hypothetical protein SAMN02745248_02259 [Hathewaya proteolytica DSM 3090]
MKKGEGIGALIGSLVGAVGTGIAVYFTGSVWSALIGLLGYLGGSYIGKLYDRKS